MNIQIRERNLKLTSVQRAHVKRRLGFALSRYGEQIGRVTVRLSDGGGGDKRCRIDVSLRPKNVQVEDADSDVIAAADHATHRVSRSVARALERERGILE